MAHNAVATMTVPLVWLDSCYQGQGRLVKLYFQESNHPVAHSLAE